MYAMHIMYLYVCIYEFFAYILSWDQNSGEKQVFGELKTLERI